MNPTSRKRRRIDDDVEWYIEARIINNSLETKSFFLSNDTTIRSLRPFRQLPGELASWARGASKLIRVVEPGHYIGIENGIKYVLRRHKVDVSKLRQICLDYDMDGVRVTDSTTNVFWPIWVRIGPPYIEKPFLVGNYHSLIGEPKDSNSYSLDFVNEQEMLTKFSVEVDGKTIAVRCVADRFLGDTPGRCLILSMLYETTSIYFLIFDLNSSETKGPTGYFGFSRCTTEHAVVELDEN